MAAGKYGRQATGFLATQSQIVRQQQSGQGRDRRPGGGSCDKKAPALTGLRREIRAPSCRWMALS